MIPFWFLCLSDISFSDNYLPFWLAPIWGPYPMSSPAASPTASPSACCSEDSEDAIANIFDILINFQRFLEMHFLIGGWKLWGTKLSNNFFFKYIVFSARFLVECTSSAGFSTHYVVDTSFESSKCLPPSEFQSCWLPLEVAFPKEILFQSGCATDPGTTSRGAVLLGPHACVSKAFMQLDQHLKEEIIKWFSMAEPLWNPFILPNETMQQAK